MNSLGGFTRNILRRLTNKGLVLPFCVLVMVGLYHTSSPIIEDIKRSVLTIHQKYRSQRQATDLTENVTDRNGFRLVDAGLYQRKISRLEDEMQRLRCVNKVKTECFPRLRKWFDRLLARQAPADDPDLVLFTRQLIDPPSSHHTRKLPWGPRATPQAEEVDKLLKHKRGGFFVEAGAQDGERASNSVWLELERDWTGLLVEIDPWFYTQMRSKLRRSYTINAGLSPYSYITELTLEESGGGLGKLLKESAGKTTDENIIKIPCIPVQTLLLALNQTTVDYFSLDVEGFENDVIRTIPYSKFDIKTWSIEYSHTDAVAMKKYMIDSGYNFVKQLNKYDAKISLVAEDYIFQKK